MDIVLKPRKNKNQGKKGRKVGRNKSKCEVYRASGTRERNKALRAARHAKRMEKQNKKSG